MLHASASPSYPAPAPKPNTVTAPAIPHPLVATPAPELPAQRERLVSETEYSVIEPREKGR